MGKNPSFPFYPSDWTRDLDDYDLEIEGAWIRTCCRLWWSDTPGELTKTLKDWSNIFRTNKEKTLKIINIFIEKKIADGEIFNSDKITIINRRMFNDNKLKEIRKENGSLGGNPKLTEYYNKPGYVYAVLNPETGYIKIGIALNPTNRISKLRYKINKDLKLLQSIYVEDMGKSEKKCHDLFLSQKVMGEWFKLTDDDINTLILTLKGEDKGDVSKKKGSSSSSSSSSSKPKDKRYIIPDDLILTDKMKEYAHQKGIVNGKCEELFEAFFDWHKAKGDLMADWLAAWRTWVRNDIKFNAGKQDKPKGASSWTNNLL